MHLFANLNPSKITENLLVYYISAKILNNLFVD